MSAQYICSSFQVVIDPSAGPAPVGVQFLSTPDEYEDIGIYSGVSYCDAVRRAGEGKALRILPGSINVCQWAPVVLGLKAPESRFEEGLSPRLDYPVPGLLLAPFNAFPGQPEVAIVRAAPEVVGQLIRAVGEERLWRGESDGIARSAISLFTTDRYRGRHRLVMAVNRPLATLARSPRWQRLTQRLFGSTTVTKSFETIISHALADMSICRNSTVIPLTTGQINISHFCTGGITWGRNSPTNLTSGWPCRPTIDR